MQAIIPKTSLTLDLFLDFCCPWCLIGVARIRSALELVRAKLEVSVTVRPFLLDPGVPEGGVNIHRVLLEKHGMRPEQVFPSIEAEARASGIALDLMRQPMAYATNRAHALIWAAREKGTSLALAGAVLSAYFLDLRPIDQPAVLAEIATKHGFKQVEALSACDDPDILAMIRREARVAVERGVTSVPTLGVDGTGVMSASQPPNRLADVMRRPATGTSVIYTKPDLADEAAGKQTGAT